MKQKYYIQNYDSLDHEPIEAETKKIAVVMWAEKNGQEAHDALYGYEDGGQLHVLTEEEYKKEVENKPTYKKCLIEVNLPFKKDGSFDMDVGMDNLNDIGKYFSESDIKKVL